MSGRERLAAAISLTGDAIEGKLDATNEWWTTSRAFTAAILAADPTLEADLEMGAAWREAESALPEGMRLSGVQPLTGYGQKGMTNLGWVARASGAGVSWNVPSIEGEGPTPTLALRALTEALRRRS